MKFFVINIFVWSLLQFQIQKYDYNSTHSYSRETWIGIRSLIVFPAPKTDNLFHGRIDKPLRILVWCSCLLLYCLDSNGKLISIVQNNT